MGGMPHGDSPLGVPPCKKFNWGIPHGGFLHGESPQGGIPHRDSPIGNFSMEFKKLGEGVGKIWDR